MLRFEPHNINRRADDGAASADDDRRRLDSAKDQTYELPEALSVTGDLDGTDTAICSLPPDIKVGGKLIGLGEKF
jgi:hypothetical protein